jgi:uncharacterized protein YlxW (UPF0749 family)
MPTAADASKVETELKKIYAAISNLTTKVAAVENRLAAVERAQKTADLQNRL